GPWNYPGVGYYRPLTSLMFFLEQRAFDQNFTAYNRITWVLHGLNAGLLFLIAVSLLPSMPRIRVLCGVIAAYFFGTSANSMSFASTGAIRWWPAQNDPLCTFFILLCFLFLTRYMSTRRRGWLMGSSTAFVAAIWSKELGHVFMPAAVSMLIWNWWRGKSEGS